MTFGHRSYNQPCIEIKEKKQTNKCLITSQNHGFAVAEKTIPKDWQEWFVNANDGSNEGIKHNKLPFQSVQFHPEATPGPTEVIISLIHLLTKSILIKNQKNTQTSS